jgi:hypothetical protein
VSAIEQAKNLLPQVPDPEAVRDRLAIVQTEAGLLRAQLRVSARVQRERDRLRRLFESEESRRGN